MMLKCLQTDRYGAPVGSAAVKARRITTASMTLAAASIRLTMCTAIFAKVKAVGMSHPPQGTPIERERKDKSH